MILIERDGQIFGGACLVGACNWKNHPPMTSQKIRTPRAAATGLQQSFVGLAEVAQVRKAGDDDLLFWRARHSRIARNNIANQLPVNFIARNLLVRIKPRVIEKLPRGA